MSLTSLLARETLTKDGEHVVGPPLTGDGVSILFESGVIDAANSLNSMEVDVIFHDIVRSGTRLLNDLRIVLLQETTSGDYIPFYTQPVPFVNPEDGRNYKFIISPSVRNPDPAQPFDQPLGGGNRLREFTKYGELPDKIKIQVVLEERGVVMESLFASAEMSLTFRAYQTG